MAAAKFGAAAVGVVILLLGVVAALGYVPGLSVTCVSNCNQGVRQRCDSTRNGHDCRLDRSEFGLDPDVDVERRATSSNPWSRATLSHTYAKSGTYTIYLDDHRVTTSERQVPRTVGGGAASAS